jgi:hypothetical protein
VEGCIWRIAFLGNLHDLPTKRTEDQGYGVFSLAYIVPDTQCKPPDLKDQVVSGVDACAVL